MEASLKTITTDAATTVFSRSIFIGNDAKEKTPEMTPSNKVGALAKLALNLKSWKKIAIIGGAALLVGAGLIVAGAFVGKALLIAGIVYTVVVTLLILTAIIAKKRKKSAPIAPPVVATPVLTPRASLTISDTPQISTATPATTSTTITQTTTSTVAAQTTTLISVSSSPQPSDSTSASSNERPTPVEIFQNEIVIPNAPRTVVVVTEIQPAVAAARDSLQSIATTSQQETKTRSEQTPPREIQYTPVNFSNPNPVVSYRKVNLLIASFQRSDAERKLAEEETKIAAVSQEGSQIEAESKAAAETTDLVVCNDIGTLIFRSIDTFNIILACKTKIERVKFTIWKTGISTKINNAIEQIGPAFNALAPAKFNLLVLHREFLNNCDFAYHFFNDNLEFVGITDDVRKELSECLKLTELSKHNSSWYKDGNLTEFCPAVIVEEVEHLGNLQIVEEPTVTKKNKVILESPKFLSSPQILSKNLLTNMGQEIFNLLLQKKTIVFPPKMARKLNTPEGEKIASMWHVLFTSGFSTDSACTHFFADYLAELIGDTLLSNATLQGTQISLGSGQDKKNVRLSFLDTTDWIVAIGRSIDAPSYDYSMCGDIFDVHLSRVLINSLSEALANPKLDELDPVKTELIKKYVFSFASHWHDVNKAIFKKDSPGKIAISFNEILASATETNPQLAYAINSLCFIACKGNHQLTQYAETCLRKGLALYQVYKCTQKWDFNNLVHNLDQEMSSAKFSDHQKTLTRSFVGTMSHLFSELPVLDSKTIDLFEKNLSHAGSIPIDLKGLIEEQRFEVGSHILNLLLSGAVVAAHKIAARQSAQAEGEVEASEITGLELFDAIQKIME